MRAEKQILTKEYVTRLNASPFFIVVDYQGLKVGHLTELRKRLNKAGAEVHVVKNSIFRIAAKEAGVGDLNGALAGPDRGRHRAEGHFRGGQGREDVSAPEFDKLKVKFGYLEQQAAGAEGHPDAGGFAEPRSVARQIARSAQRAGHEAGRAAQHARDATGARAPGESRQRPKRRAFVKCELNAKD